MKNEPKKVVQINHKKSFANTHTGNALDKLAATAVTVVVTTLSTYAAALMVEKLENARFNDDINKMFKNKKNPYQQEK